MNKQTLSFKDYIGAIAIGMLISTPFIIEIIKDLL